jgi:hypothetical protein
MNTSNLPGLIPVGPFVAAVIISCCYQRWLTRAGRALAPAADPVRLASVWLAGHGVHPPGAFPRKRRYGCIHAGRCQLTEP